MGRKQRSCQLIDELPEDVSIWADEDQVDLVIRNLLSNALKFTPENGKISISGIFKETHWEIAIKDTGVGISPENMTRIFKPNTSFTTHGTRGEKGTGLGLLLCQEMIEKNGGKIWIESVLGQGTTFYFTLFYQQPIS